MSSKLDGAGDNEKDKSKYGYLKRKAIMMLGEMNDRIDDAFGLPKNKYQVSAFVALTNTSEEDNPYKESKDVKNLRRDQVAKEVGDLRSILFEVRKAEHFKNRSYTREITTWQTETRDVKNYVLDSFREDALVVYDYSIFAIA